MRSTARTLLAVCLGTWLAGCTITSPPRSSHSGPDGFTLEFAMTAQGRVDALLAGLDHVSALENSGAPPKEIAWWRRFVETTKAELAD